MLPKHVRLLLLSATVGNAPEFIQWLRRSHDRKLELVESNERKVPLSYEWVPDQLLNEHAVTMCKGDDETRKTPALLFCFNRDECWTVAEQLKGLPLVFGDIKSRLHDEVNKLDWKVGVGPKIKQLLHRGVGVHHAGLLPKYRRVVEALFEKKLLAFVVCTETLAAGINLPARSVLLTRLVKGPPGKEKLLDASVAHQIFGRAGRPQFDDRGYVVAIAHEDDVRILRWKEQYDQIPENTKDPNLIKAKKKLKKKKPTRSDTRAYWSEGQFQQLQSAKPGKLYSKGPIPWRLLAYLLEISPEIKHIRKVISKRLLDDARIEAGKRVLDQMLITLARGGFVTLEPELPCPTQEEETASKEAEIVGYSPKLAHATPELAKLLIFRSIHPLYGAFLLKHLGIANRDERLQALESVLELPRSVLRFVRVPFADDLPPGPLATTRLDNELVQRGLILARHASNYQPDVEEEQANNRWDDDYERPPFLADKLQLLFEAEYPEVHDVRVQAVWAAGDLLKWGGDFDLFIQSRSLARQEGMVFRHFLRLILLCGEFAQLTPNETTAEEWQKDLEEIADRLTISCRDIDPQSTEEAIERAQSRADVVEGEAGEEHGSSS